MRKLVILFFFVLSVSALGAYDFPAPGGRIISFFGSMDKGQFNTGIDIQAENAFAAEAGEVLYYGDDFVAVAHDDSILTLYSNLDVADALKRDVHVKKGQSMGQTKGGILHFAVYDLAMEQYMNPLLMTETVKKSELPRVKRLSYEADQSLLSVYMADKINMGLCRVQVSVNGHVLSTLGFRTIKRSGDALVLDAQGVEYDTLYGRQGAFTFPGIELKPGENNVDIIVTDFYGKKVVFHGRITV